MGRAAPLLLAAALGLAGCPVGGPEQPNLLVVSLDTVRADRTTPYAPALDTTPTLARLAARGTVFVDAFSPANESAYAHAALFTGRMPSEVAAPDYRTYALPEAALTFPEVLRAAGYRTAAFVAGGHVGRGFGFDQGFDHFADRTGYATLWHTLPEARRWLDAHGSGGPWMVFAHGYDAHQPYLRAGPWSHLYAGGPGSGVAELIAADPPMSERVYRDRFFPLAEPPRFTHPSGERLMFPSAYRALARRGEAEPGLPVTPSDAAHLRAHYDGALVHMDLLLGRFLSWAERRGHLEHTLLVVLSDHGEGLLDHGYVNHRSSLHDVNVKVPLLVVGAGFEAGARVRGLVDLRDVAPTMLRAAGVDAPGDLEGRPLQDVAGGAVPAHPAVHFEGVMDQVAVRTLDWKLVYDGADLSDPGLPDRIAEAPLAPPAFALYEVGVDPGEREERLAAPDPAARAAAAALRDVLVRSRRSLVPARGGIDPATLDPAVVEQMRRHGYWEHGERKEQAVGSGADNRK